MLCLAPVLAVAAPERTELADLSLEELADIRITSVSKHAESLSGAAASVYVITGEEIRRSAATTLPEALRLAPNLQVSRVDARNYAVTARGFSNPFENKLLVMIDGRTIYSPLFSGVYWDAQDVVLDDVERIEVVSGPGSTIWGVNAVNGVINIITRNAADTQGTLVGLTGSGDDRHLQVRHGGTLAGDTRYRVYAKAFQVEDGTTAADKPSLTGMRRQQAGFRADWKQAADSLALSGDAYQGALHQEGTRDIDIGGANLVLRWNRALGDGSTLQAQVYLDHTERDQPNAFRELLDTVDVDLSHAVKIGRHALVWGGGYRTARDRIVNGPAFSFLPTDLRMHWGSLFVQDEISLADTLRLTGGARWEHNHYTGGEFLPTLRLSWQPAPARLLWTALTRSVRAPSRIDRDLYAPSNAPVVNGAPVYALAGGPQFQSEVARTAEIGYRAQPSQVLTFSAAVYYTEYDKLRTLEPNPAGAGRVFLNLGQGRTRGFETWGNWQAAAWWRLSAGYTSQNQAVTLAPGSKDNSNTTGLANNDPAQFWSLRSHMDLGGGHELDLALRHTGQLPAPVVPAYTALDVRYGWKIRRDGEISVMARNLLSSPHAEFGQPASRPEYDRGLALRLSWWL